MEMNNNSISGNGTTMARKDRFCLKRFLRYLSFEVTDTVSSQGLAILITGLAPVILFSLYCLFSLTVNQGYESMYWENVSDIHTYAASICITLPFYMIFPIVRYGMITGWRKGAAYLQMPASEAEKLLSAVLISLLIVPAIFIVLYFGSDWIIHMVFPDRIKTSLIDITTGHRLFEIVKIDGYQAVSANNPTMLFLPFTLAAAGLAGAVMFKRNKIFLTIMTSLAILAIFMWITIGLLDGVDEAAWTDFISNNGLGWSWTGIQTVFTIICCTYFYWRISRIQL